MSLNSKTGKEVVAYGNNWTDWLYLYNCMHTKKQTPTQWHKLLHKHTHYFTWKKLDDPDLLQLNSALCHTSTTNSLSLEEVIHITK